jgi:two-component system response regulator AtoC
MPMGFQAKLLRVLEQREVVPVGALRPRPIDVRFLAATNRDLKAAIADGRFRQDLYYRLAAVTLPIPPLRERPEDIASLAHTFARQAARSTDRMSLRISSQAMGALSTYRWPGNVRELKNVIERAALICGDDTITVDHLCLDEAHEPTRERRAAAAVAPNIAASDPARKQLIDALDECGGNQREAAKRLGMARGTLIRRIEQFGLSRPRKR